MVILGLSGLIKPLAPVKKLKPDAESGLMEAFDKEVKFMSRLNHDNVVRLLGVCSGEESFIMMEYMENGDLNQFMANYLLVPDITQDSAGLKFYYGVMDPSAQVPIINHTLLLISDSKFHNNTGGGVSIHVYKGYNNVKYQMIIEKCLFEGNVNKVGSSLVIVQPSLLPSTTVSALGMLLKDTNFTNDMTPEPK